MGRSGLKSEANLTVQVTGRGAVWSPPGAQRVSNRLTRPALSSRSRQTSATV